MTVHVYIIIYIHACIYIYNTKNIYIYIQSYIHIDLILDQKAGGLDSSGKVDAF